MSERQKKARKILDAFASAISSIEIDSGFEKAINLFIECRKNKGKIVVAGIGKAGIAMRKFSATLCSIGFPSCFLHPGEASHGDLGVLSEKDILFVASTSGKTREVLEVIDLAKQINVKVIGITSHKDSQIRDKADIIIDMGEVIEEGHLQLAPTTSILVMIAITDALALIASEAIGYTKQDYYRCHHSGYLGEKSRS